MVHPRIATLLVVAIVLNACSDNTGPDRSSAEVTTLESAVANLGFRTEGLRDVGNYVVVEGDIALSKAQLLPAARNVRLTPDTSRGLKPLGPNLQWVSDARVSAGAISNMVVDLSGISSDQSWTDAARAALGNWNAIPGTTISFSEGTSAQIHVAFKFLESSCVIALANFPIGATGQPGDSIFINTGYGYNCSSLNVSQKTYAVTHELGHTIGFRHTNWQSYTCNGATYHEGASPLGASQISGTPATDGSSVMNACSGGNSWTGFSHYDEVAASVLYNNLALSDSNVGGYPVVLSTYPRGAMSVRLTIEWAHTEWYDHLQQYQTTYWSEFVDSPASGGQSNVNHPWGYTYCSNWNDYPYPQDQASYKLEVEYSQRTATMFAEAHVLSGGPGYSCY